MDIYNCLNVFVMGCLFDSNGPVTSLKTDKWRGHAGGLSIAFHSIRKEQLKVGAYVNVMNCTFLNNTSDLGFTNTRITTNVLTTFIFKGRGGGAVININSNTAVSVLVKDCTFQKNYASAHGGGLYIALGIVANHSVIVQDSQFLDNHTPGGAGGLNIGFVKRGSNFIANKVFAINLHFFRNSATHGGGSFVFNAAGKNFRRQKSPIEVLLRSK